MGRATWTACRVIVAHLLRVVLVGAFHLLFGLHLQRLRVLLLQCCKLRLHISTILAGIVVHLLLLELVVLALCHGREFVLLSEGVRWKCSPLTVRAVLSRVVLQLDLVSLPVDLHHVDLGQVVLHLFQVFLSFAVDRIKDVLDLVWAHVFASLVLRLVNAEGCLADWGQMLVLVGPC